MGIRRLNKNSLLLMIVLAVHVMRAQATPETTPDATLGATSMATARQLLREGRKDEAWTAYQKIPLTSPAWTDKVEDLIRFHLRQGSALEAWRMTEVLAKLKRPVDKQRYYSQLSVFRAGSCPLSLPDEAGGFSTLLRAAVFRSGADYLAPGDSAGGFAQETLSTHLAPGLRHDLADLPATELLAGRGCRFEKSQMKDEKHRQRAELTELVRYLRLPSADSFARLFILIRAYHLATQVGTADGIKETLAVELRGLGEEIPWAKLADPERRILFRVLFPDVAGDERDRAKHSRVQALVLRLLLENESEAPNLADWLSLLDVESLSSRERQALFSKLVEIPTASQRDYLLYMHARAQIELGQMQNGLTTIRRLLVEQESPVSEEVERAVLELVGGLFREHRFDNLALGALQAAIPGALWRRLLEQVLVDSALQGHATDFRRAFALKGQHATLGGWNEMELKLLRAMAERQLTVFIGAVRSQQDSSYEVRTLVRFAEKLAPRLLDLAPKARASAAPFLRALTGGLHRAVAGRPSEATIEASDLIQVLNLASTKEKGDVAWLRGHRAVREGTIAVGVANLRENTKPKNPFLFQVPSTLPRRALIFIPDQFENRKWKFSTEIL